MKKIFLIVLTLSLSICANAIVSKTINLTTAGTLSTELSATELTTITNLTVTGKIDARDFKTMRDKMPVLGVLDISAANITAYTGKNGTYFADSYNYSYAANTIPTSAFFDNISNLPNSTLTQIFFPSTLISINSQAFQDCKALTGPLNFPTSLIAIESSAFASCISVTGSISIPESLTSIGSSVFFNCGGFFDVDINNLALSSNDGVLFNKSQTTLISCPISKTGTYNIPSTVSTIGAHAFYNCSNLTGNLIIPSSVTSIKSGAFSKCTGFTGDLVIPSSVTSIEGSAFSNCTGFNGTLTLPPLSAIEGGVFSGCNGLIGPLIIPSTVLNINSFAFMGCSGFTGDLIIPSSVNSIGFGAFSQCTGFDGTLTLPSTLKVIENQVFNNCSKLSGNLNIPPTVTSIGESAFANCSSFTDKLVLPSSILEIKSSAFSGCSSFTGDLTIPTSVLAIGNSAFQDCTGFDGKLTIPPSISIINDQTFMNCIGLIGDIIIPETITAIGNYAFSNCSGFNESLSLPASVNSIGWFAFNQCTGLKCIDARPIVPIDISSKSNVFSGINKSTCVLYVNSSSKEDYGNAIQWKDFEIIMDSPAPLTPAAPFGCTAVRGDGQAIVSFNPPILTGGSSIESYTVTSTPDGITATGTASPITVKTLTNGTSYTFKVSATNATNTSIPSAPTNVVIPFSPTKSINLTAAGTLSSSLTASELASITNLTISGKIDARDFKTMRDAMPALEVVDLAGSTVLAYTGTAGPNGTSSQTYPINEIPQNSFHNPSTYDGKTSLKAFIFPAFITSIGQNAFRKCSGTNTIIIPSTVTNIGVGSFNHFSGLIEVDSNNTEYSSLDGVLFNKDKTTLIQCPTSKSGNYVIPSTVVAISDYAFDSCINLTGDLNIPSSVTTIGRYAFNECKGFEGNLTIPTSVTSIDVGAFYNCSGFTGTLNIPSSLKKISESVFYGCSGFSGTLIIPSSITHISSGAFWGCSGLTGSVTIPSSVTWIGNATFSFCANITGMSIPSTVTHIGSNFLYYCSGLSNITAFSNTPISFIDPIYGNSTNVFTGVNKTTCILYVPASSKTKYATAPQWKDFFNIVEMPVTSIKKEPMNNINLFPNPVTSSFQIHGLDDIADVTILDLSGNVLTRTSISEKEHLSIANFPQGTYIVKITNQYGTIEQKIIKQ